MVGNTIQGNKDYGIYSNGADCLVDQNTVLKNLDGNMTTCVSCVFGLNNASP